MAHTRARKNIAIIGGGIAGLSAAHELAKFYDGIHVFEAGDKVGGKACSQNVHDHFTAAGTRPPKEFWIGEHGFRLFPHTYRHVIETMKEIPVSPDEREKERKEKPTGFRAAHVADRLVGSTEAGFSFDGALRRVVRPFPHGGTALLRALRESFGNSPMGNESDYALFGWYLLKYITSCPERRDGEYDDLSWLEYVGLDKGGYSPGFEPLLKAIPRGLNAMKPDVCSARSFGNMMLRFAFDFSGERGLHMEQVLAGPTQVAWLEPWREHLSKAGVRFHLLHKLEGFSFDERTGTIDRVYFKQLPGCNDTAAALFDEEDGELPGLKRTKRGEDAPFFDAIILALPIEAVQSLLQKNPPEGDSKRPKKLDDSATKMRAFDGGLQRLLSIRAEPTAPMVGLQFYLREEMAPLFGHMFYPGSAWSLTSVSQLPFWKTAGDLAKIKKFNESSGGKIEGILSVIVSNWKARGPARTHIEYDGKLERVEPALPSVVPADGPSLAEFKREVWFQLKDALNEPGRTPRLSESMLFGFPMRDTLQAVEGEHTDPHVRELDRLLAVSVHVDDNALSSPTTLAKEPRTPLFIHPRGSYSLRPEAQLRIPNLLLAADYVRTDTDLATMEAANEAAKRAVLAILWRDPEPKDEESFPKLYRQSEPAWALAAQAFDRILYRMGQGHFMDLPDLVAVLSTGAFTNMTNIARQFLGQEPVRGAPPPLAPERLLERAEAIILAAGEAAETARKFVAQRSPR